METSDRYSADDASSRGRTKFGWIKKTKFVNNAKAVALLLPCWIVLIAIIGQLYPFEPTNRKSETFPSFSFGFIRWNLALIFFTSPLAVGAILLAALATFVFDGMGLRFLAIQVPVIIMAILNFSQLLFGSFLLQQSVWYIFLLCQNAIIIAVTAAWICLQFPWLSELAPDLVLLPRACERALFTGLPLPAAALITWALLPIAGTDAAPFVFTGILFFNYTLCVLPMASSFAASPPRNAAKAAVEDPDAVVLSRFDTGLNTMAMIFTPSLFYLLWHCYNITSLRLVEALALFAAPFVWMRICSKFSNPYWFLGIQEPNSSPFVRVTSLLGMSIVVSAAQVYVIAGPLGHYIVLEEPWNYVSMAFTFYAIVVLFEIFTGGIGSTAGPDDAAVSSSEPRLRRISYIAGCVAAVSSSFALGLPLYMLPAPLVGSISAVSFFWRPRMSKYLVFTATLAAGLLWFIFNRLWFIDFEFLLLPISLRTACVIALLAFLLSVLIPGIVATQHLVLSGLMMLLQASLVSFLEGLLFYEPGVIYYPWYMIVATSCLGCVAVWRLGSEHRITKPARWIVCSVYISKLALLLQPLDWAVLMAFGLVAPFSRISIFWFYDRTEPMTIREGVVYSTVGGLSAFLSRNLQLRVWDQLGMYIESEMVLLGSSLLVASSLMAPITWKHLPDFKLLRLVTVAVASTGAALILIFQPSAAIVFEGRYGAIDFIMSSPTATYGFGMFAIPLFLTATGTIELSKSNIMRAVFILVSGSGAGLIVTKFALPDHFGRTPIYVAATFVLLLILTVNFLVFAQTGDAAMDVSAVLVYSYAGILACGALLYFFEGLLAHLSSHELQNFRIVVLGVLALANISVAMWLNFFVPQKHKLAGTMRTRLPLVANIAVLAGFGLAFFLNIMYLRGSEGSIFLLAPILLLRRRSGEALASPFWFPSLVIVAGLYIYTFCWVFVIPVARYISRTSANVGSDPSIIWRGLTEEGYALTSDVHISGFGLLLEVLVALSQLPAHLSFMTFLRRPLLKHHVSLFAKIAFVMLGLAGFFAASIPSVRYLSIFGAVTVLLRLVAPEQLN